VALVQDFCRQKVVAFGAKNNGFGKTVFDQLQRHQPVVYVGEIRTAEINQIHLNSRPVNTVVQGKQKGLGIRVVVECRVNEIDTKGTNSLLLVFRIVFVEANVEDDFVGFFLRRCLESDPNPPVSFERLGEVDGRNGIGKGKITPVR
jgi:hypothetical protein